MRRRKNVRGRTNLEIMSSAFIAEQVLSCCTAVGEIFYETNRILAQKKRCVGVLREKISARAHYRIAIFLRCQVSKY
jgi:hypothetical protein